AKAYGWKLLARDFRQSQGIGAPDEYVGRLHAKGYKIVVLERRDVLQQAISMLRAEKTRHHHHEHDDAVFEAAIVEPVRVLVAVFLAEESNSYIRKVAADLPHLRLVYEDDLRNADRHQFAVDRVCAFMDLPSAPAKTDLVKVTPERTQDLVS